MDDRSARRSSYGRPSSPESGRGTWRIASPHTMIQTLSVFVPSLSRCAVAVVCAVPLHAPPLLSALAPRRSQACLSRFSSKIRNALIDRACANTPMQEIINTTHLRDVAVYRVDVPSHVGQLRNAATYYIHENTTRTAAVLHCTSQPNKSHVREVSVAAARRRNLGLPRPPEANCGVERARREARPVG